MKPIIVQFEEITMNIPWDSLRKFSPHVVVGIERGGVVLATIIASRLGSALQTIRASFYDDSKPAKKKHDTPKVDGSLPDLKGLRVLIVDDVSNTGKTLAAVKELVLSGGAAKVSTFVYAGKADFSCRPFERCLVFPWQPTQ